MRGRIETFQEAEELRAHVTALTERFEQNAPDPWQVSDAPEDYLQRQFKGIVGLRLTIEAIEGKAKLSQNRSKADQDAVVAALGASGRANDLAVSGMMKGMRNSRWGTMRWMYPESMQASSVTFGSLRR